MKFCARSLLFRTSWGKSWKIKTFFTSFGTEGKIRRWYSTRIQTRCAGWRPWSIKWASFLWPSSRWSTKGSPSYLTTFCSFNWKKALNQKPRTWNRLTSRKFNSILASWGLLFMTSMWSLKKKSSRKSYRRWRSSCLWQSGVKTSENILILWKGSTQWRMGFISVTLKNQFVFHWTLPGWSVYQNMRTFSRQCMRRSIRSLKLL